MTGAIALFLIVASVFVVYVIVRVRCGDNDMPGEDDVCNSHTETTVRK